MSIEFQLWFFDGAVTSGDQATRVVNAIESGRKSPVPLRPIPVAEVLTAVASAFPKVQLDRRRRKGEVDLPERECFIEFSWSVRFFFFRFQGEAFGQSPNELGPAEEVAALMERVGCVGSDGESYFPPGTRLGQTPPYSVIPVGVRAQEMLVDRLTKRLEADFPGDYGKQFREADRVTHTPEFLAEVAALGMKLEEEYRTQNPPAFYETARFIHIVPDGAGRSFVVRCRGEVLSKQVDQREY